MIFPVETFHEIVLLWNQILKIWFHSTTLLRGNFSLRIDPKIGGNVGASLTEVKLASGKTLFFDPNWYITRPLTSLSVFLSLPILIPPVLLIHKALLSSYMLCIHLPSLISIPPLYLFFEQIQCKSVTLPPTVFVFVVVTDPSHAPLTLPHIYRWVQHELSAQNHRASHYPWSHSPKITIISSLRPDQPVIFTAWQNYWLQMKQPCIVSCCHATFSFLLAVMFGKFGTNFLKFVFSVGFVVN